MNHETLQSESTDSTRPSWAVHELVVLALTLILAVWVVAQWSVAVQPQANTERDEKRAATMAELGIADEKALNSFGVVDESLKRYRIPIQNAMTLVVELGATNIAKEVAGRTAAPTGMKLVEIPDPDFLADVSELNDPALIAQGKTLFLSKACYTCHQNDPAVPAPAGLALRAPKFIGDFWGKERLVHKGMGGPLERVVMGPGYFAESVSPTSSGVRVLKGALTPMPPPPPVNEEEIKALMAYVRSLSQGN